MLCRDLAALPLARRVDKLAAFAVVDSSCRTLAAPSVELPPAEYRRTRLTSSLAFHFALDPSEAVAAGAKRSTHCDTVGYLVSPDDPLECYERVLASFRPCNETIAAELMLLALAEEPGDWLLSDESTRFPSPAFEQKHSPGAYVEELYRRHFPRLLGWLNYECSNSDRENLAQQAFFDFYRSYLHARSRRRFAAKGAVEGQLKTMARQLAIKEGRHKTMLAANLLLIALALDVIDDLPDESAPYFEPDLARKLIRRYVDEHDRLPPAMCGAAFPDQKERDAMLRTLTARRRIYSQDYFFDVSPATCLPYGMAELAEKYQVSVATISQALADSDSVLRPQVMTRLGMKP